MTHSEPARIAARRIRSAILAALVFVGATLIGVVAAQLVGHALASSSSATSPRDTRRGGHHPAQGQRRQNPKRRSPTATSSSRSKTRVAETGAVRRGLRVFDEVSPAVTNLDRDLLRALRQAARDAAEYRVEILVNSGWRSPEYQELLFRQAVSKYGSEEKAARWVATADTSSHVSGHAVDIGPSRAAAWLSKHGAAYRLCQIYRNEPWHYELRPEAIDDGCPPMYADPSHDPRIHQ
jgi:zinc D-Ala-D-Ala carboxypeptidase